MAATPIPEDLEALSSDEFYTYITYLEEKGLSDTYGPSKEKWSRELFLRWQMMHMYGLPVPQLVRAEMAAIGILLQANPNQPDTPHEQPNNEEASNLASDNVVTEPIRPIRRRLIDRLMTLLDDDTTPSEESPIKQNLPKTQLVSTAKEVSSINTKNTGNPLSPLSVWRAYLRCALKAYPERTYIFDADDLLDHDPDGLYDRLANDAILMPNIEYRSPSCPIITITYLIPSEGLYREKATLIARGRHRQFESYYTRKL